MVLISERPAEAEDRAVPGHWEGDLIMGSSNRSAIGTLVERTSRYVLLFHLGADKSAVAVEHAMRTAILTLPAELRRSVTWDQGKEMGRHAAFTRPPGSRCSSATRTPHGNAARTKTSTSYCGSTCPRAPTCH